MNDTPTPETDGAIRQIFIQYHGVVDHRTLPQKLVSLTRKLERERDSLTDQRDFAQNLIRILERERDEAREYADKLVAHKDMVCLPKDLEVLREANLGLAMELHEAREAYIIAVDQLVVAQSENRKERALADRLAKAIQDVMIEERDLPDASCRGFIDFDQAILALDAWKEARK